MIKLLNLSNEQIVWESFFDIRAEQIAFWSLCHLQIVPIGSIVLPERQNYGFRQLVTLLIKWPGLEAYSGRILAYVELENQESTDDLEP